MPKQSLNTHLHQYYEEKHASPKKLAQLVAMAEITPDKTYGEKNKPTNNTPIFWQYLRPPLALGLVLAAIIALFFFQPRTDITQSVGKEIVLNHNKRLALEFPSQSYTLLENQMSKLDFTLVHSKKVDLQNFQLLGARYCSIQGELAAQLRLEDKAGRSYTLYQSPVTDDLLKIKSGVRVQDGLRLKLWQEAGLFFGLVGPLD
ncbi:hypothetical protein MNBD_NITROSPIRAE01-2284 [hydrothermal vent metagenome]|uniref:Uncharacterized protein n=1 Tax=hydrothermal vent metagenome TaxID=652676 RepID=A0A3B1CLL0_9ZZZZ